MLQLGARLALFRLQLVAAMSHPWTSMLALAGLQAEMNQWVNLAEATDPVVLAVARESRSVRV